MLKKRCYCLNLTRIVIFIADEVRPKREPLLLTTFGILTGQSTGLEIVVLGLRFDAGYERDSQNLNFGSVLVLWAIIMAQRAGISGATARRYN